MSLRLHKIFSVAVILLTVISGASFAQNTAFVSDLSVGAVSSEVLLLQQTLNSDPDTTVSSEGAGSVGNETNYFGPKTKLAVIRFQEKYSAEILAPLGLFSGTGIVGPRTRAILNRLNGGVVIEDGRTDSSVQKNKFPIITKVIPGEVADPKNTPVTIVGENFTANDTVFLSVQDLEMFNGHSTDGKTMTILLDSAFIDITKNMVDSVPTNIEGTARQNIIDILKTEFNSEGKDGVYVPAVIFVQNQNGESNKFLIKINVLKDETNL